MSSAVPAQATTPPAASYKPGVAMPIIPPPAPGTDPVGYYDNIMSTATLTVLVVSPTRLSMTMSKPAISDLFAVTGGSVTYIPNGAPLPLPGSPPSPGGSLVLQTWVDDVNNLKKILPAGVPPELYALYLNVKDTSVRAALDPFVRALSEKVLRGAWNKPGAPGGITDLQNNYLDRVLLGQVQVFVPTGTKIGEAGPATTGSDQQFTLVFMSSAGNELSPLLHLRGMATYADPKWTHHPVAQALESIVVPVSIFLQFEVWNKTTKAFEKLPANVPVDVVDYDPLSPNDVLATQMTDAAGRVQFNFPNLEESAGELPDLFFVARTNGISHAGHTLPAEWSTKGWKSANGEPGYYENFAGTQLGDASNPLVFRVGLDFHIKLEYRRDDASHLIDRAPKGVPIGLKTLPGPPPKVLGRTDEQGEIHDVVFDISGEDDVFFEVNFEIEDSSINLPRARALTPQVGWNTFWEDADRTRDSYYPKNDRTSIGTQGTPASLRCTVNDRNLALFFLKIVREWNTFFFHMTGGAWTGVTGLEIWRNVLPPATRSFSWPVSVVQIHPDDHWNRGTIVHELSHQVVWKQANYSTLGIAVEARLKGDWPFFGQLALYHWTDLFLNSEQALIEGWPEFIEAIFEHTGVGFPFPPRTPGSSTVSEAGTPNGVLGPPPNNRGESVEGAFANGLWKVFVDHVVANPLLSANVPESPNGDITATTDPWLTDPAVHARFMNMIWFPLGLLADLDNPTTTNYIEAMESTNTVTGVWPALKATLQTCNMAF